MLDNHEPKTARLEVRLPESVHALFREAASLQGRSLSEFVVASAHEVAEKAVAEREVIRLSPAEQQRFAVKLLNPDPIAPAMQRASQQPAT